MSGIEIGVSVNDELRHVEVAGHESAVDVIRDQLGLTGTKLVCGGGVCGACTVLVDGVPTASCLLPATTLRDSEVTTVEGLGGNGALHPVQLAFLTHDAMQCGYCTPGFVVDAVAFYERWRAEHGVSEPDRHTIADALAGHLCRCGAYAGIYRAVAAACRGDHDSGDANVVRVDGPEKVTGRAIYTADVQLPEMLHAVFRRSTIAAARVDHIGLDGGPYAVEVLGEDRRVRWSGQPIAAVAAESLEEARRAAAKLHVELTPLPFVLEPEAAKQSGAPPVYEGRAARKKALNAGELPLLPSRWRGNRRGPNTVPFRSGTAKRRVRNARDRGDAGLIELEFETAVQVHTSFEPHACVADWTDPGRLRLWVSTQAVDRVADEVAEHFDLDPSQVEVVADHVGGAFGAKLGLTVETTTAAKLSRLSGRPVRLVLDRHEELTATGNRPGTRTRVSMLSGSSGNLQALLVDTENHAGVAVGNQAAALAVLMYGRSPRRSVDEDVVTNAPPGLPFRGPGGPTMAWAVEQTVDAVAHRIDQDPIELRRRWDGNPGRQALYEWAAELDVWKSRPRTGEQTGRFRRGVGVAAGNWLYNVDPDTEIVVSVEDARLVASTASQDMGTGSRTVVARAVAGVFGIDPEDVEVRLGRSNESTTHGPVSGGSRTTVSLWSTAQEAASTLRKQIGTEVTSAHNGKSASARRGGDKRMRLLPFTIAELQVGRGFTGAVHVTEVEVDTHTGKTRVLRVHGGISAGKIHARELARSQCEGGIIQGIGLALYENRVLDPHSGLTLTSNLEDYRIPQLGDTPEIHIHFHEDGWDHVPGGGVGLGEVATMSPAASVGNAIHNATGWRPTSLPVRPDRLIDAMISGAIE